MTHRRDSRRRRRPQTGGQGGAEPRVTIRHREGVAITMSSEGYSQHVIADRLGISQPAVSKILQRVDDRWVAENRQTIGRQQAKLLRQSEAVFNRAIVAFDESGGERVRRSQRKIRGATGSETMVTDLTAETSVGDPRHLEVARKTVADRLRACDPKAESSPDLPTEFIWRLDRPTPPAAAADGTDKDAAPADGADPAADGTDTDDAS